MFINAIFAAAILAASAVTAAPSTSIVARQQRLSIQLCNDAHYIDCYDMPYEPHKCANNYKMVKFNDSITSLGGLKKNTCTFYADPDCSGARFVTNEDVPDISKVLSVAALLDNKISSFQCGDLPAQD
ncbi:hypothetical protein LZ554_006342 [Drepanopeziza brunnea f. sp. 'monogermtubi']|nr:hypothetical protein LZ554_006342 [Drepanopeziza brunnea f. sp. 'monogermtubi']